MTENKLSIRLATKEDYEEIMIFSKGLYGGNDYLPKRYHDWLNNSNVISIVGTFEEKVIGYVALHIVDGGKTVIHKALRIDSNYRSRGFGGHLTDQADKYANSTYKSIIRARSSCPGGNFGTASYKMSIRLGYKAILKKAFIWRLINSNDRLENIMQSCITSALIKCSKKECTELLLNTKCDLFPNNIHIVAVQGYDVVESNIDEMFGEKDRFCYTLSKSELTKDTEIESFSHTRFADRNIPSWDIILYANEITLIRDHIVSQVRDILDEGKDRFTFSICCNEEIKSRVECVLTTELGLDAASVSKLPTLFPGFILFEKAF